MEMLSRFALLVMLFGFSMPCLSAGPDGAGNSVQRDGGDSPPIVSAQERQVAERTKLRETEPVFLLVIDPGHPSEIAAGSSLLNGVREVEINWQVAVGLRDLLAREPGMKVLLTRAVAGQMMTNRNRAEFGNREKAALMLRLHCDAGAKSGFAIYFPSAQGKIQGTVGPSAEVIMKSGKAAKTLHAGMAPRLDGILPDKGILTDRQTAVGAKNGALIGSIFSRIPILTVEMACLTEAGDAGFIASPDGQKAMIEALAAGIRLIRDDRKNAK